MLLEKLGRIDEAITAFQKASELSEASYALGRLLSREGRTSEARPHLEWFKSQRDRETRRREAQRRANSAFQTGQKHLEEGRREEAAASFLEVTELDPTSYQGYAFLAKSRRSLGDIDAAIESIRRAILLAPGASEYPYLLSAFLRDQGDLKGALTAAERAVALGPRNALLHNTLGVILSDLGNHDGAVAAFERAVELDLENPAYSLNLAAAYDNLGEKDKSAEAMERYRKQIAPPKP